MSSTPPWHLWGTSETVTVSIGGAGPTDVPVNATSQLAKVSYGRPETWHWLFVARLVSAPAAGALDVGLVMVDFNLIVGLARTSTNLDDFEQFSFRWANAPAPTAPIYSTRVVAPVRSQVPPLSTDQNLIDQIVAQEIQCNARVEIASNYTSIARVEVAAFFAPNTHVRPDWMRYDAELDEQFTGGEIGAR